MQRGQIRAQPWVTDAESQHGKRRRLGHYRWLETSLEMGFINKLKIRLGSFQIHKSF